MKHPVDTSTWGEFKVGELFDCQTTKAFYPTKENLPDGETPYVSRSTYNNGISGYYTDINNEFTIHQKCITIGAETGIAFWQEKPFIPGVKVYTINHEQLNSKNALFLTTLLNKSADNYGFTQLRSMKKLQAETITLPLKPGTNLADYTQDDIDWNYMEQFMSRVQDAAKERLANLPEPGQKPKTSVDVSGWGEFKVGELFDLKGIKQVKSQHHVVECSDGIPFVVQSNKNNMVKHLADRQWLIDNGEPVVDGNAIVLGVTLPVVSYQESEFGASQVITARNSNLTKGSGLFIASVMNAFLIPKYSYINKPGLQKYKDDVIPLPLKPHQGDYIQDDIDWDYMERFMEQFQKLAKNRVGQLTSTHDCDILTV